MKILIVEDEAAILADWKVEFTEHRELELYTAANRRDAERLLDAHQFSMVFIDMGLPLDDKSRADNQNGFELLKRAKKMKLPVCALTGTNDPELIQTIGAWLIPMLEKPIENFEKDVFQRIRGLQTKG